ncbi:Hypothetical_protein [Hexamita inflata]|uniref:Hypothetical_protein n=1 Tax=Hexamita inflata TaxID=28002 RepID=A0AA86UA96_9EUKA|nr:Hypothetical protein HINF_LOCUS32491 [Hexamita inflata]
MLSVGSELASQSQRESARLEVQPLLDPNKLISEVQANQRNNLTTENDEYESVSVLERAVGPSTEFNMQSESTTGKWDLPPFLNRADFRSRNAAIATYSHAKKQARFTRLAPTVSRLLQAGTLIKQAKHAKLRG